MKNMEQCSDFEKPQEKKEMVNMTFQDMFILKQFVEKGLRDNFFNSQESPVMIQIHGKLEGILRDAIAMHSQKETQE